MTKQEVLYFNTQGRGMLNLTPAIAAKTAASGIITGICHLFLHHTSASLILCENADPAVQGDLEAFMRRLCPDGDPLFQHTAEGPDDMSAHVRTVLTKNDLTIPVTKGKLSLGTWQGIYIWEHRLQSLQRKVTMTVIGDKD